MFSVTRSGGTYSLIAATDNGSGYQVGDRIIIAGDQLGGETPTNDLKLRCTIESTEGDFLGIVATGDAVAGEYSFTIQIMAVSMPLQRTFFKNLEVAEHACRDGIYRYTTGLFLTKEEARKRLRQE